MIPAPRPASPGFFVDRRPGTAGLAVFLNAGDPDFDVLEEVVLAIDAMGVDCLELAVPFPDSVTDGPVIRRSATRALAAGADVPSVLRFLERIRPRLVKLRIALLVDWSWSLKGSDLLGFLVRAKGAGADALLVHALPPALRPRCFDRAVRIGLPIVTTCYATSGDAVRRAAAAQATAYLYLVAQYGRSGTAPAGGYGGLTPIIARLRDLTTAPIAVGFGVRTGQDVAAVAGTGADAAIIGSAAVAAIERAVTGGTDPIKAITGFLALMGPKPSAANGPGAVPDAERSPDPSRPRARAS